MRIPLTLFPLALLLGCAITRHTAPARPTATGPATTQAVRWSNFDVHARTCLFSGNQLPPINVLWRGDPHRAAPPFAVKTTYYDAAYNPVTRADKPGRYGAIVELTVDGRTLLQYLSLYRFPEHVDWDYIRMPTSITLPRQFGINNAVTPEQHENFSEFFKYALQRDAERCSVPAMILAGLYEAKPAGQDFVARNGFEALDMKWWAGLKRTLHLPNLPYLVHLPPGYDEDTTKRFPLILFLHGSGEAGYGGEDLAKLRKAGLAALAETGKDLPADFPFIVISPQCPPDADWSPYDLERLMEEVESKYRVDTDREYLTGLSLGGYGTWDYAIAFPHRFAAIAPMSGAGDPADVARIKDLPTWIFHGAKDGVVPVEEAHRMHDALTKIGGRVRLTIYPDAGHNSWTPSYRNPELWKWLFEQRRGEPAQAPATRASKKED